MSIQSQFPREVMRIMAPQIQNLRLVIRHHFQRRHSTHSPKGVRAWIAELRKVDQSSGYSKCVRQVNDPLFPVYRTVAR